MTTTDNIILTTGIYDMIKDHVRRRKVNPKMEDFLNEKLENAEQVRRVDLPEDVVTTNTRVTLKDHSNGSNAPEEVYVFVAPRKARRKHKTESIASETGIAIVGYKQGDIVEWPSDGGIKKMEIVKVENLPFN